MIQPTTKLKLSFSVCLVSVFLNHLTSFATVDTLLLSSEFEASRDAYSNFIGCDDSFSYMCLYEFSSGDYNTEPIVLIKFDQQMQPVIQKEITINEKKTRYNLVKVYMDKFIYVVTALYNPKKQILEMYQTKLDPNSLEIIESHIKWLEFPLQLGDMEVPGWFLDGICVWVQSPDKTKNAFVIRGGNKNDRNQLDVIYFDAQLNETARKTYVVENVARYLRSVCLSNDGNIGFSLSEDLTDSNGKITGYSSSIYCIPLHGELIDLLAETDKKNFRTAECVMDLDGNYRAVAFYDNRDQSNVEILHVAYNFKTSKVEGLQAATISEDMVNSGFTSISAIILPGNEVAILAEYIGQYAFRRGSISDGGVTVTKHYCGNLVLAKIDKEGRLAWVKKIEKNHHIDSDFEYRDKKYVSAFFFYGSGNIINVVFNDRAKNYEADEYAYAGDWSYITKSVLINWQLDIQTGEVVDRKMLCDNEASNIFPEVRKAEFDLEYRRLYLTATKGNQLRFGRVDFAHK